MLVAIAKPHQQYPVPLDGADFEFATSDDGDESGRVTLPPVLARSAVMTQIGDDLHVYCPRLSKTVWRGQIERIEEGKDGSVTWHAIGFGALQRDARISVVQTMGDMSAWKPVGQGFLAGSGYDSRPDLWEYEFIPASGVVQISIKTKRTFTISATTLFFIAYLFDQPERYVKISSIERLNIINLSTTGLASGIWVAPITAIPQPDAYTLTCGTFTSVTMPSEVDVANCYGWVAGVAASGNETTAGATSVRFRVVINSGVAWNIDQALLSAALIGRGGSCNLYLPGNTSITLAKPDANLRDIIDNVNANAVGTRYQRRRFLRDTPLPTIDFRTDSPYTWRFPETARVTDISKVPNRVYARYRGYWADHLTAVATVLSLESRRQTLAWRLADVGEYGSKAIAETQRDEAAKRLDRQIAPISIDLDNNYYELMMRNGVAVPNWAADVGDYADVPNYYRSAKITARTISRERTSYTVSFQPDDFVAAFR